jgi:hypothetical protein
MMKRILSGIGFLLLVILVIPISMRAQGQAELDSSIESLRADARADKTAIITEAMQLKDPESTRFWTVYRGYEKDLASLNGSLIQLVKSYASEFGSIDDAKAEAMSKKSFDIQARKIGLKKKYYPLFARATSPLTAAKFFQLEHRFDVMLDLQLSSELPALLMQHSPSSTEMKK